MDDLILAKEAKNRSETIQNNILQLNDRSLVQAITSAIGEGLMETKIGYEISRDMIDELKKKGYEVFPGTYNGGYTISWKKSK